MEEPATSVDPSAGIQPLLERLVEQTLCTPIREGSAVVEAVGKIGRAIAVGVLRPGDRLPSEARLADAFGISPVTLRGALSVMREGGLMETRRGRGGGTVISARGAARVRMLPEGSLPDEGEMRELTEYRALLEGGATSLAADRATEEQFGAMGILVEQMERTVNFPQWGALDSLFHLAIADATGIKRLVAETADVRLRAYSISSHFDNPMPRPPTRVSNQQHGEILAALRLGDSEGARVVMVRHVNSTLAFWLGLGVIGSRPPSGRSRRSGIPGSGNTAPAERGQSLL